MTLNAAPVPTLAAAQGWCTDQHRLPAYGQVWAVDGADEAIGCASVRPDSGWLACIAEVGYWIGSARPPGGAASAASCGP